MRSPRPLLHCASVVLGLAALLLGGCGGEPEPTPSGDASRPALIERVEQAAPPDLVFSGVVRSANRANLAFRMNGRIIEIRVAEGESVTEGQLLARLDPREYEIAAESARLEFEKAEADYRRGLAIYEQSQAISLSDLEQLQTARNLAENAYENTRRDLRETELRAPFDGVIGRKLVENFTQVQANEGVLVLQDLQQLEVVVNVPSRMIAQRDQQEHAVARFNHLPGRSLPLSVRHVASDPDPRTQTWQVVFAIERPEDLDTIAIVPGMTARVTAVPPTHQLIGQPVVIPLGAVAPDNLGGQYVWVVNDDDRAEKRAITPGELLGNRLAVAEGLQPGERIVVTGLSAIEEGMRLRPLDGQ